MEVLRPGLSAQLAGQAVPLATSQRPAIIEILRNPNVNRWRCARCGSGVDPRFHRCDKVPA
ncbi:MAG: hypothetical protein JOZ39_06740 [Chloroflexi bacterium]|nr:hypothetical protein [Chloroflexota bacterium]